MVGGFLIHDQRWRKFAFLAALQSIVFFWTVGFNETVKYFAVAYPVAFLFVGVALTHFESLNLLRPPLRIIVCLVFAAIVLSGYVWRQHEWAQSHTIQWHYRPILDRSERLQYLSTKIYQLNNIYLYDTLNRILPQDAVLLFPDNTYPFYVDRRFLWTDEDLKFSNYLRECGVEAPADLVLFLADRRITHVVASSQSIESDERWTNVVEADPTTAPLATSRLYRVRNPF